MINPEEQVLKGNWTENCSRELTKLLANGSMPCNLSSAADIENYRNQQPFQRVSPNKFLSHYLKEAAKRKEFLTCSNLSVPVRIVTYYYHCS